MKSALMKFVIIIPDGGGDLPIATLGGLTPMQAARQPNTCELAARSTLGVASTTPAGFEAGSDVCSMSLLGYDPRQYHTGRAPLEAAALGLALTTRDWIFRLNFVTTGLAGVNDAADVGNMLDHSAGAISDGEARELLRDLLAYLTTQEPALLTGLALHPGVSYRNIMVDSSGVGYAKVTTTPPHAVPGEAWREHLPTGDAAAEKLRRIMLLSAEFLPGHRVNVARRQAGKRMATMAWIWGQGTKPTVPSFASRFGLRGCMITSVDLLRGIAAYIGWERVEVAGLTSYHDTDYAAQGRATIAALDAYDVVCCHVESPDEASHQGDVATKVASLEAIDTHIVGPVMRELARRGEHRLLMMPDHYTLCSTRKHDATPVPFLLAGTGIGATGQRVFTEDAARATGVHVSQGHELIDWFVRGAR
jgi:2,3-bisphosphoglycerate-independent phosphoglycerate mutase